MIISIPTAQLCIKSDAVGVCVETVQYPERFNIFEQNDFMNNVVYVEFARGPPVAA